MTSDVGYTVGPHVTTDLARFTDLVSRSRSAPEGDQESELLRRALDLLRGQPFEGVRGYDWAFTEGMVVEAEAMIADKLEDGFIEVDPATGEPFAAEAPNPPAPPAPKRPPSPAPPVVGGLAAPARRFEYVDGTSSKFWAIELKGRSLTVNFGRIGSGGQTRLKTFDDEAGARKEYEKLIAEKTRKGYVEKT